ncbi:hypothetical protein, partial [Limnohabitans sp. DM1]|uniref:hypothetical protein n=1 Tax=Limnohabitans sp. DM1 TaxID=1597955 RepID=UPI001E57FACE
MARGAQSTAFVRQRKLPLPCLVGALLSQRSQSQQLMLDSFFASLAGHPRSDEHTLTPVEQ